MILARPQAFDTSQVLYKALGAFWNKGYEATSLSELIGVMGLSKSSLYATFGGKRELFLAAFDLYREDRRVELYAILNEGEARAAIERYFRLILTDASRPGFANGCMSINQAVELAPHDPEVRSRVQGDFDMLENALAETVERGQVEGTIRLQKNSSRLLARILMISFPGLQVMVRAGKSAEWLDEALAAFISVLD